MAKIWAQQGMLGLVVLLAVPTLGSAQDIFLASGGADLTWRGTQPNAAAGTSLDQGAVGSGDTRRDLIVGSPGGPGISGAVYVISGGPDRTGDKLLSSADTKITTSEVGNRFGFATAAGHILALESAGGSDNLVVGAPGASGNRGIVYLFTGAFPAGGPTLTDANAVFKIIGAPGDLLGTSLATGDLDNDGRREIIIGAPGNGHVYIIKGSSSLSGTLDLSGGTVAPNQTLTAAGIGGVVTAGDVTGDGVYDLVVGDPSQNLAFLYAGTTGAIPTVPLGSFSGVAAGDEAGSSLRIFDIDADGKNDLAIGAPGVDGPVGGRLNSGAVYVFLGPITPAAMSLNQSQVVFFGAAAGLRAGAGLAAGDINRDAPNDLVISGTGGSAGSGEIDIYYGRSRASIGALQPGGRRFVDMATAGQISRRILGDPGLGSITSVQVFEVTGEGARDVIVGVAAAEAGAGKLFFTISPKLRVSPTTLSLTVNQGGTITSPTVITATNPSVVSTGWTAAFPANAPADQRWVSATPSAGTVDDTHTNTFRIVASSAGLTPGVHVATLNVTSTSPDLTMTIPITVTLTVTGATVAIDAPAEGATVSNGFSITGWAVDTAAAAGTGVTQVQAYAYPTTGAPLFLGTATYGGSRPDVAAAFGDARFTNSGYSLQVHNLTRGASYQISVFARSTVTGAFASSRSINVTVSTTGPAPTPGPTDPNPAPPPNPNGPGASGDCSAPTASTAVAANRTGLFFGATNNGALKTGAQPVTVTFSGGCGSWSATTTATWLDIASGSGLGAGTFTVAVKPGTYAAGTLLSAVITVTAPGSTNSPLTIPVQLRAYAATTEPFGAVDTPADNAQGIVGSIGVTGWALDDIQVSQVTLWRNPMPGETASASNGKVFIGNAVQVEGARPDVDATYSQPFDFQAGWGYLLLTNMLPNQGNGTFTLFAYADDVEGHRVLLGSRTITCDNAHATKPFGAIDTPTQGGTVSGTAYVNFGWVLTPNPNTVPINGSTIMVYIDGVPVGHPTYNQFRSDIATLFPGYANTNGAVGFYTIDTTTLSNGVHTIAWGVTDNAGNAEGIGSRYFTVLNGAAGSSLTMEKSSSTQSAIGQALDVRVSAPSGDATGQTALSLESMPASETPVYLRSGFDQTASLDIVTANPSGVRLVEATEMKRFQLTIGSPVSGESDRYEGYMVANGRLQALPAGAFLDRKTGEFFWQPGVGFTGTYRLVFVRVSNWSRERIPVDVHISAR